MIYFDNAATTAVSPAAAAKAAEMMSKNYGNPSSLHLMGLNAEKAVREASETLAEILRVKPEEIIFTSGGTESNNLAILGAARAKRREGTHILTSAMEHPSVERAMKALEAEGFEITRISPGFDGLITPDSVLGEIRSNTVLISLIHVNNETGSITDLAGIASAVKRVGSRILIHADGVQGFCKEPISLENIDLYSISAHKIHGMKGVGALRVKSRVNLKPLLFGGGQQKDLRPGTENTAGVASMATAAMERHKSLKAARESSLAIKGIISTLASDLDNAFINGSDPASAHILNMSFIGVKGEILVHALENEGIFISTGSACSSKKRGKNALAPLGYNEGRLESAVRFSFSEFNTQEEARICREFVIKAVSRLRRASKTFYDPKVKERD